MKSRQFIFGFGICLVVAVVSYCIFFQLCVVKEQPVVPGSYKQFLLEEIEGARIIIDGGSNGLHAFDARLMEEITGYPTLILSDHAGASLHDKIERLYASAREGDVVILSLEWNYYHANDLSDVHLRTSLKRGNYYFHSLPWWQQWQRAFKTPPKMVIQKLMNPPEAFEGSYRDELNRLQFYYNHNYSKAPNGEAVVPDALELRDKGSICDDYILPEFAHGTVPLSKDFVKSIRMLRKLKKEGVEVIIIPPLVVGFDCYERYGHELDEMLCKAHLLFEREGLNYLSDYRLYAFSAEYMLDTHFHATEAGRAIYTPILLGELIAKGWLNPYAYEEVPGVFGQIPDLLKKAKLKLMAHKMPMWRGNPTEITLGDDRQCFCFWSHWYEEEAWGRWASGEVAELIFRPDPKYSYSGIYINAQYFNGSQKTRVFINDQLVTEQDFTLDHIVVFEGSLNKWMNGSPLVRLRFESTDLESPAMISGVNDPRLLKFGLHSMELILE